MTPSPPEKPSTPHGASLGCGLLIWVFSVICAFSAHDWILGAIGFFLGLGFVVFSLRKPQPDSSALPLDSYTPTKPARPLETPPYVLSAVRHFAEQRWGQAGGYRVFKDEHYWPTWHIVCREGTVFWQAREAHQQDTYKYPAFSVVDKGAHFELHYGGYAEYTVRPDPETEPPPREQIHNLPHTPKALQAGLQMLLKEDKPPRAVFSWAIINPRPEFKEVT